MKTVLEGYNEYGFFYEYDIESGGARRVANKSKCHCGYIKLLDDNRFVSLYKYNNLLTLQIENNKWYLNEDIEMIYEHQEFNTKFEILHDNEVVFSIDYKNWWLSEKNGIVFDDDVSDGEMDFFAYINEVHNSGSIRKGILANWCNCENATEQL